MVLYSCALTHTAPSGVTTLHSLAHEVLQHRAFPGALTADHGDLRQVNGSVLTDGGERILHLVDQRNQVLHATVPHLGWWCVLPFLLTES